MTLMGYQLIIWLQRDNSLNLTGNLEWHAVIKEDSKQKAIWNNMMLCMNKKAVKTDKVSKKISAILSERETQWNEAQNEKLNEKLELKLEAIKARDCVKKY